MSILIVLAGCTLLLHLFLVFGWVAIVRSVQASTQELSDGFSPSVVESLSQLLPRIAQRLQRGVVEWNDVIHLRESSNEIISLSDLEQAKGQPLNGQSGLTMMLLFITVGESLGPKGTDYILIGTLSGMTVLSLIINLWSSYLVRQTLLRFQLELDTTCPSLPSADNVTRDVMTQLQKQMGLLRAGQKASLKSLFESQKTLTTLGQNLQFSFQQSVQETLAPTLENISLMAVESQQANQQYVEETTRKQSQVVQSLIVQVLDGVDQAIGESLRETSDSFAASVQRQQVSMDRWRRSVESVAEVITSLEQTTRGVTLGAERMAQAAEPVQIAAQTFSQSAQQLQAIIPVVSQLAEMVLQAQGGLTESHTAIQKGTQEYLEITGSIERLVTQLNSAHIEAIERIKGGVEDSLITPFATMSNNLEELQSKQLQGFEQLQQLNETIQQTVQHLDSGYENISGLAGDLQKAGEPSIQAALSFTQVSDQLQQIVPRLELASQLHENGATTLQRMSDAFQVENNHNIQILEQVQNLVGHLDSTQSQMAERVAKGVDEAMADKLLVAQQIFVDGITVATDSLQSMGQTTRDALEHASQSMDQSVQEVGRKLNQRIEEAGQTLEQSAQLSAESLTQGASHAHDKLSQVGDGWSNAIQEASDTFRGNADYVSETVTSVLSRTQQELGEHLQQSLEQVQTQMTLRLDEGVSRQQNLIEQASQQQTQAAQALINSTQQATDQVHQNLRDTQDTLQSKLVDFGTDLQVSLQEIFQQYQNSMASAARQQNMAGQSLVDQAQQAGERLQHSMQEAQVHTRQVLEQISGDMVLQLGQVHNQYSQTLERSQQSMSMLVTLQEGHVGNWKELVQTLTPALTKLSSSTGHLELVIQTLQASMVPATTVSENFVQASSQLQAVLPNIAETSASYHRFNQSLNSASTSLAETADQYSQAGSDMGGLLVQIEQSLGLQNQSNSSVSQTLTGVQRTIDSLDPIVRLMQQASQDMRVVSEGSTSTVETMKQATESQNQSVEQMGALSGQLLNTLSSQSNRLQEMMSQMERLQQVLTVGVDAFAQTLPQSVDGTLVQFDSVLAEGVLRINGSIERLREAMDDLIEQLER